MYPDTTVPTRELFAERLGLTLTPAEMRVLELAAAGFNQPQTARALGVATITVSKHRSSIMAKINARNITHAVHLLTLRGVVKEQR
jgi:DNA-binding CsgD family transcriptional regulator